MDSTTLSGTSIQTGDRLEPPPHSSGTEAVRRRAEAAQLNRDVSELAWLLGRGVASANWKRGEYWGEVASSAASVGLRGVLAALDDPMVQMLPMPMNVAAPARSALGRLLLSKTLASEALSIELAETGGRVIAGAGHKRAIDDLARILAEYGGKADDWVKVATKPIGAADGSYQEIHVYRNLATGEIVEAKTNIYWATDAATAR